MISKKIVVAMLMVGGMVGLAAEPKLEFDLTKAENLRICNESDTEYGQGRLGDTTAVYFKGDATASKKGGAVEIPIAGKFDFQKPFSVSLWFKVSKDFAHNQTAYLLNTVNKEKGPGFILMMTWNTLAFRTGDGTAITTITTSKATFPIEREVWNHVVITCDGKKAALYFNGVLAAESAPDAKFTIANTKHQLSIGSYNGGFAYTFKGAIGEVKLFDSILSPSEILKLTKGIE